MEIAGLTKRRYDASSPLDSFDYYDPDDVEEMLNAFFKQLASGWDIEPREVFEREAATNGFRWAICQALHHTWKRDVKLKTEEHP